MTRERNRATILRFFQDVMGTGDLNALDELAIEEYEDHVALPGQGPGRAGPAGWTRGRVGPGP